MLENIAHLYIWNSCSCILMMAIFFPHSHFSFCRPLFLFCSCFLFHSHAPFGFCFRFGAVVVVSGGGISFYSVCVATDTFGRWRTRCFFFHSGPNEKYQHLCRKKRQRLELQCAVAYSFAIFPIYDKHTIFDRRFFSHYVHCANYVYVVRNHYHVFGSSTF